MWSCSLACAGAGADSARSAASDSAAAQDAALKPPPPPRRSEASIAIPIQSVDLSGFVGKPGVLQSGFPPGLFLFFCALSLFLSFSSLLFLTRISLSQLLLPSLLFSLSLFPLSLSLCLVGHRVRGSNSSLTRTKNPDRQTGFQGEESARVQVEAFEFE